MSPTCCPPVLIGFRNVFGSEAMGTAPAPGRATHSNFGSREAEFAVSRTYMPARSQSATGLPSSSLLDTNLRATWEDRWKYEQIKLKKPRHCGSIGSIRVNFLKKMAAKDVAIGAFNARLQQTMIRIKDPKISIPFYEKNFGFRLIHW